MIMSRKKDTGQVWQPIETAPRDGKRVILYGSVLTWSGVEKFIVTEGIYNREWSCRRGWITPTHWMPLPEPPKL